MVDSKVPAVAGLAVGLAFVLLFALMMNQGAGFTIRKPFHVTVVIPKGSSLADSEHHNFEPAVIKVVIGLNNTVKWINQDIAFSSIRADDMSDPEFYNATHLDEKSDVALLLKPGETFEFTFTKPGDFGYHGEPHPHERGTVIVLPASEK